MWMVLLSRQLFHHFSSPLKPVNAIKEVDWSWCWIAVNYEGVLHQLCDSGTNFDNSVIPRHLKWPEESRFWDIFIHFNQITSMVVFYETSNMIIYELSLSKITQWCVHGNTRVCSGATWFKGEWVYALQSNTHSASDNRPGGRLLFVITWRVTRWDGPCADYIKDPGAKNDQVTVFIPNSRILV